MKEVTESTTTITRLGDVISILEGDHYFGPRGQKWAMRIIRECRAEQQRQLARGDRATLIVRKVLFQ